MEDEERSRSPKRASSNAGYENLSPLTANYNRERSLSREKSLSPCNRRKSPLTKPQHVDLLSIPLLELQPHSNKFEMDSKLSPRQLQVVGYYDIIKTIGSGQFGKVKLAKHVLTHEVVHFLIYFI